MKFQITLKDPDWCYEDGVIDDKPEPEKAETLINKFLKWGEYVTLEFDTDKGTCEVLSC